MRDEACALENLNRRPGLDTFLEPLGTCPWAVGPRLTESSPASPTAPGAGRARPHPRAHVHISCTDLGSVAPIATSRRRLLLLLFCFSDALKEAPNYLHTQHEEADRKKNKKGLPWIEAQRYQYLNCHATRDPTDNTCQDEPHGGLLVTQGAEASRISPATT